MSSEASSLGSERQRPLSLWTFRIHLGSPGPFAARSEVLRETYVQAACPVAPEAGCGIVGLPLLAVLFPVTASCLAVVL